MVMGTVAGTLLAPTPWQLARMEDWLFFTRVVGMSEDRAAARLRMSARSVSRYKAWMAANQDLVPWPCWIDPRLALSA